LDATSIKLPALAFALVSPFAVCHRATKASRTMSDPIAASSPGGQSPILVKVTTFITRDRGEREILVLRPANNGAQLPAMPVAPDTTPETAALQVVAEKSGQAEAVMQRRLGVIVYQLEGDQYAIRRPVLLRTTPQPDATLMRFTLERGMMVRLMEMSETFARVVYEEYALNDNELAIATRRAGWVNADALTKTVEHHLFHFSCPSDSATPSTPDTQAEWATLSRIPGLSREQENLLASVRAQLETLT
jgi:hypothetical protein